MANKDRKSFARDLKTIYNAPNEEQGRANRNRVTEKWSEKYPNAMKRREHDWDVITPFFKFSLAVRTVIYTTNAIESLNATYRKLNRQRSVFPSDKALLKALYLATFEATKKWTFSGSSHVWIQPEFILDHIYQTVQLLAHVCVVGTDIYLLDM